jgi:hypothetical protein
MTVTDLNDGPSRTVAEPYIALYPQDSEYGISDTRLLGCFIRVECDYL